MKIDACDRMQLTQNEDLAAEDQVSLSKSSIEATSRGQRLAGFEPRQVVIENFSLFPAEIHRARANLGQTPGRPRNWRRWWQKQGRCLPKFSSLDLLATIVLWIGATCGWEWYRACPGTRLPFGLTAEEEASPGAVRLPAPTPDSSQRLAAAMAAQKGLTDGPTVTTAAPDGEGFFGYQHDRFQVKVPVALRQLASSYTEPELTRARGRKEGLRFELDRVFDYRARDRDLSDVAREFAAQICQAAGAVAQETHEEELVIGGQRAVRTRITMRQTVGGRIFTVEGLTLDEGLVAWSLWAGYDGGNAVAAETVNRCFASVTLHPLSAQSAAVLLRGPDVASSVAVRPVASNVVPAVAAVLVEPRRLGAGEH
jgi:hypothetical protein